MIRQVTLHSDWYVIDWAEGKKSIFHFIWLRDNCSCASCGNHTSGSRFQTLLAIPETIAPTETKFTNDELSVVWSDEHKSRYEAHWLSMNRYTDARSSKNRRAGTLWNSSLESFPAVDYQQLKHDKNELWRLFASVASHGFVIVKRMGPEYSEVERLTKILGYTRDTHFGLITDLKLRKDSSHLSNFPTQIMPHTDETYRQVPTGINIFYCVTPSGDGGGVSTLVDSHYCAELLREHHPQAFEILTRVPIRHERHTADQIIRSELSPILLDFDGNITEVRLNERTMSAISVPPDLMLPTYKALREAFHIAYARENRIEYLLKAGEALVFDNLRVLHGRTAFQGDRLIRQTNVMRDEFYAQFEFLRAQLSR